MWEVELNGKFEKYDATIGKALVEAKSRGAEEYRFDMKGQPMVVNFKTMTQTNTRSGKSRPVRDTSSHGHHHSPRKGGKGGGKGGVYPEISAPVYIHTDPSAPPAAPSGGVKVHEPIKVHDSEPIHVHEEPAKVGEKPKVKNPLVEAKVEAEPPAKGGVGFKTGVAVGVTAAGATALGVAMATGAVTGSDIADVAKDAGEAIADAAEDVGEAIVDACEDVADFVS